ncbi:MAG: 2TM domain-containing protein [Hydrogenophaga sp.]|nr:2TM domain-containing protein [Hydrogenophaga sp.]
MWSLWPAAGWGFGLLMHGMGVFGFGPGSALRERMLERERERLRGH